MIFYSEKENIKSQQYSRTGGNYRRATMIFFK